MRPASDSASPPRAPAKPNPTPGENDSMMMGFEFFNEKGQLSPRKILFTENTCPNKTQRVLSHLFGGIMKWNARRWAENFLENTRNNQPPANKKITEQVDSLLQDIRKEGFVRMTQLFSLVASATAEAKPPNEDDDQTSIEQTGNRFTPDSTPFLINRDEVVKKFQIQSSSNNQGDIGNIQMDSKGMESDNADLLAACQIIEDQWKILSEIRDGELAPPQYKLPAKSGFLDYCRGNSDRKTEEQAIEQATSNTLFIAMDETEWSSYKNIMTEAQYAAWTKKRDEWIALKSRSTQVRSDRQTPKRDLRLELKTEKHTTPTNTAQTIAQEFSAFTADFNTTSHGNLRLPLPVEAILDSGFIAYCDRGIEALQDIDLGKLEKFLEQYESKFQVFSKILSPENFSELKEHQANIAKDIAKFRATHPVPSNASEDDSEMEIRLSGVDVTDITSGENKVAGLFSEIPTITLEKLKQIEWDATDLHLKISLADVEKIQTYFSAADISKENLDICQKLGPLSRKMQESYVSDPRHFDEEKTSNTKDPARLLVRIYSDYSRRQTTETRQTTTASKTKRSARKTKTEKKSTSAPKKKTGKDIKTKPRSEAQKSIETKNLNESQTLNQEARQQLKKAYALISRINEKLNNIQQ